jgi:hypothetical protein
VPEFAEVALVTADQVMAGRAMAGRAMADWTVAATARRETPEAAVTHWAMAAMAVRRLLVVTVVTVVTPQCQPRHRFRLRWFPRLPRLRHRGTRLMRRA